MKTVKMSIELEIAQKSEKYLKQDNAKQGGSNNYNTTEIQKLVRVRPQNQKLCTASKESTSFPEPGPQSDQSTNPRINPKKTGKIRACHLCVQEVIDLENQLSAISPRPRLILVLPATSLATPTCQHSGQQLEGQGEVEGEVEGE